MHQFAFQVPYTNVCRFIFGIVSVRNSMVDVDDAWTPVRDALNLRRPCNIKSLLEFIALGEMCACLEEEKKLWIETRKK